MKDLVLRKLLRQAGGVPATPEAEMPLGFDTRVLAQLRAKGSAPDYLSLFAKRTAILAAIVILLAGGFGWYAAAGSEDDAYLLADNVIEQNLD